MLIENLNSTVSLIYYSLMQYLRISVQFGYEILQFDLFANVFITNQ